MKGKHNNPSWESVHSHLDNPTLPDEFWQDISGLLPIQGPRLDAYIHEGGITVVVELPGLSDPNHVQLAINRTHLTIKGEVVHDYDPENGDTLLMERYQGKFRRKIPLPQETTVKHVNARYQNGLLRIILSLHEESDEPIQVEIDFPKPERMEDNDGQNHIPGS
jgi:HSP20 family protein